MKPPIKKKVLPSWAFPSIERPTFTDNLRFPENLPALSMKDLGLYHGQFTSMLAYASSELAKIQVDKLRLESAVSLEFNRRVIALSVQNVQKWKINNAVEVSLAMIDLRAQLLEVSVKLTTVQTYRENYERYAAALSREMTRRASEFKVN